MSSILIIGAGISGLSAAKQLVDSGHQVTVVDKGRGVGGRMATRRMAGATFDHGAQFFTVRSPEFKTAVEAWQQMGVVSHWFDGYPSPGNEKPTDHYPRFCGAAGMTGIAKFLARGLGLHLNEEIQSLQFDNGQWTATSAVGQQWQAEKLILTCPIPQSLALFDSSGQALPAPMRAELESVRYEPCFAVLAVLNGPSALPIPGLFYLSEEPISWIADNFSKGISPVEGSVTIHSSGQFARDHYNADQNEVAQLLIQAARKYLGSEVVEFQVRRWRYAKPETPLQVGALKVPDFNLVFAGDALNGAKVEGAFLSGVEAAKFLAG